jgi:DUF3054 family protein
VEPRDVSMYPEPAMLSEGSLPRGREALLLAGDILCFLFFALLGLRSHEDGITLEGIVRAAAPFQVGWLLVAVLVRGPAWKARPQKIARLWVPAWALGLVIRTLFFDSSLEASFAVVSLLVNGVLLMLWRSLLAPLILRGR